jgi:hypothetical protein
MARRRHLSGEFKAKVVVPPLKGAKTVNGIAAACGVPIARTAHVWCGFRPS